MTDVMVVDSKVCAKCKQVKPLSEFYARSRQPQYRISECKECMKARSKTAKPLPEGITRVQTEMDVIGELARVGILARPGRDLNVKHSDVVAWGHIYLECKSSTLHASGEYVFALTERQKQEGVRGDLIVLICKDDTCHTYHIFPANDPVFYNEDERKQYIIYKPQAKHRKLTRRGKTITHLTTELMQERKDAWQLIEAVRLQKSEALRMAALLDSSPVYSLN